MWSGPVSGGSAKATVATGEDGAANLKQRLSIRFEANVDFAKYKGAFAFTLVVGLGHMAVGDQITLRRQGPV